MAGGLLSLVSEGQQNVILNSNPSKTFWKATYAKFTNYGLQKFRVDYEGAKTLQLTEDSSFTFKIPRYADLLMDCYLSVALPNIWSPIMPPQIVTQADGTEGYTSWAPYEFKWVDNIGAIMIKRITITCGNQKLQEFSGQYLLSMVQRDFSSDKKFLFNEMIGNIPELNNPANSGARVNMYPNCYYDPNPAGPEPSIRGRILYIPLNAWFNLKTQMAFPLVALQYNELQITVEMRPICEIFRIRDVFDYVNDYPYVAPNFNKFYMQMYRFLQPPPDIELGVNSYLDTRTIWNADIHLNCTYCFLSNDEQKLFAKNEQTYLFKQVHESIFYNVTGPNKIQLDSIGLISSWMWFMQRSDVNLRNEWCNYTNWPYNYLPSDLQPAPTSGAYPVQYGPVPIPCENTNVVREAFWNPTSTIGPGVNPDGKLTDLMLSGTFTFQNLKEINRNSDCTIFLFIFFK